MKTELSDLIRKISTNPDIDSKINEISEILSRHDRMDYYVTEVLNCEASKGYLNPKHRTTEHENNIVWFDYERGRDMSKILRIIYPPYDYSSHNTDMLSLTSNDVLNISQQLITDKSILQITQNF